MAELKSYNDVKFDPKVYIDDFSKLFENTHYGNLFRFNVEVLHEIFQKDENTKRLFTNFGVTGFAPNLRFVNENSITRRPITETKTEYSSVNENPGEITGSRLLDIGTSPVWYQVYAASWWFGEITLSDISEDNLACLRDWKKGKHRAEDNMIKYILDLDGNREDLVTASHRVSEKVKHIVQLDMCREPLLVDNEVDGLEFDTILLSLCQFSAAYDYEENLKVVRNYSKHLRRGGHVILIDSIKRTHYHVGNITYANGYVPKDKLLSIFESCGYEVVSWREKDFVNGQASDDDGKGAFALVCKKMM